MKNIAWIGTGVMGQSMCQHLINANYTVSVYNRTKSKAENLIASGATWFDTAQAAVEQADVICTMLGYPKDVADIYLFKSGIINAAKEEAIFIDFTTTKPSLSQQIYQQAKAQNKCSLDAPVSGGDIGAKNASLSIMIGGDKAIFEKMQPIFDILGKDIVYQGPTGSGQHTKMCNQIVIAGTMIGMCESLIYAKKSGLNLETMLKSISGGAAGCWSLDNLAPRILNEDYDPGFFVEHFIKDLEIAVEEAEKLELHLPGLNLVKDIYVKLKALGHGRKGTQALILALQD